MFKVDIQMRKGHQNTNEVHFGFTEKEQTMATARWQTFFKDAGIPGGPAGDYAVIFSDNRMRMDMLNELNKEILADLGISVMGDVIAILRHSKKVYAEISRSAAEEFDVNRTKSSEDRGKNRLYSDLKPKPIKDNPAPPERKSALPVKDTQKATKEPLDKSPQVHDLTTISKTKKPAKSLSSRFAEYVSVPAKKWKEEKGEVITISVPVNESSKSRKVPAKEKPVIPKEKDTTTVQRKSIFDRLGSTPAEEEEKSNASIKDSKTSSIFSRLGGTATSSSPIIKQGALSPKFSGVSRTKASTSSEPVITVTVGKRDQTRLSQEASQIASRPVKHVKPIPRKPLAMDVESVNQTKQSNSGARSKLKPIKKFENKTVSKSVFDRLGK